MVLVCDSETDGASSQESHTDARKQLSAEALALEARPAP